jgi:hypothetical protein
MKNNNALICMMMRKTSERLALREEIGKSWQRHHMLSIDIAIFEILESEWDSDKEQTHLVSVRSMR